MLAPSPHEITISDVFRRTAASVADVTANEGGTRSSKTYSTCQHLIFNYGCWQGWSLYNNVISPRHRVIDTVRKTRAELVDTVYEDFLHILEDNGLYHAYNHNKSRLQYELNGNLFRFIGIDKARKKRGAARDILFCNEANGITLEDWLQLIFRTREKAFLDWNPSEDFWFYEEIEESPDYMPIHSARYDQERDNPVIYDTRFDRERRKQTYEVIHSTYIDNIQNLEEKQVLEIENLINSDDYYDKVYRLGIRSELKGKIFNNFQTITPAQYDAVPDDYVFYGIDWGFEHPTVMVEIKYFQEQTWEREIYRASYRYDDDLISFINDRRIHKNHTMWCDHMPASIRKLQDNGYNARRAIKDVKDGIRFCQNLKRNIDGECTEYLKENRRYKYKQLPDGTIVEEPVKIEDDGPDAFRMGAYSELRKLRRLIK